MLLHHEAFQSADANGLGADAAGAVRLALLLLRAQPGAEFRQGGGGHDQLIGTLVVLFPDLFDKFRYGHPCGTFAGAPAAGTAKAAGGLPKGDDPKSVIPHLRSGVKKVYLIGRCAEEFSHAWREAVPCELCGTLDHAVEAARRDAKSGETVLLSPGTASFDQFKSYGERGDVFAALVKKEGQCKK